MSQPPPGMSSGHSRLVAALPLLLAAGVVTMCFCPITWMVGIAGSIYVGDLLDSTVAFQDVSAVPFDRAKWDGRRASHRIGMGMTLAADGSLVGRTRDELTAELGPPDETTKDGDWWYTLGTRGHGALFPTGVRLVVAFDAAGRVKTARLAEWD